MEDKILDFIAESVEGVENVLKFVFGGERQFSVVHGGREEFDLMLERWLIDGVHII